MCQAHPARFFSPPPASAGCISVVVIDLSHKYGCLSSWITEKCKDPDNWTLTGICALFVTSMGLNGYYVYCNEQMPFVL